MNNNIKISVKTKFLPKESELNNENIWTYFITITNLSNTEVQLLSRHWLITDGDGNSSEVIGNGVVGVQPFIKIGQSFEYNSFITSKTSSSMMSGNYTMNNKMGEKFVVIIPPFYLNVS